MKNSSTIYKEEGLMRSKEPTVTEQTLQLTTEVKYHGLTLDKGLTWKVQLQIVINKIYRALWTCNATFGKTCGLKYRVAYWIHTMVIRPKLIYGSTVQWHRVT